MSGGWEKRTLGDVLDVLRNGVNCKQNRDGKGDRISRIESIAHGVFDHSRVGYSKLSKTDKKKFALREGDILFSHINSVPHVGKTAIFTNQENVYHGVNLLLMRPTEAVHCTFLELYLKWLFGRSVWRKLCKQSINQASVNQQDVKRVAINFPKSVPEQKRIVAILDEAFSAIAKAKENAEKNLANARELFESYLNRVFSQCGDGWVEKKLQSVCEFSSGGTPSKKNSRFWGGDVPWVSGRDMKSSRIFDTTLHITQEAVEESSSAKIADAGDLLILVRGMGLAHGAQIGELMVPAAFNQDIRAIYAKGNLNSRYLLFALRTRIDMSDHVLSNAAHGTLKINTEELRNVDIPIPALGDQERLVDTIDNLSESTRKIKAIYEQKLANLDELKQSLLQKAFTGQLTSKTVELEMAV